MASLPEVIHNLTEIKGLNSEEIARLLPVTRQFEFRVSGYYAGLINWSDPDDPLRRIVLPTPGEIESELTLDPSSEAENTPAPGVQHKYGPTALLLVSEVCAAYCRFCFRKRFTLSSDINGHIQPVTHQPQTHLTRETTFDVRPGLDYIQRHPEINNVLLTGGDPLMLSVGRLETILKGLRNLPQVKIIRIGTKIPAFDPERLTGPLLDMLAEYSTPTQRIYLMVHFNHPRELTSYTLSKLDECLKRGLIVTNQTPLLKGINDRVETLVDLFNRLAEAGVPPYYLFHCRPTKGNESFQVPVQCGVEIVNAARAQLNGLARRFRYLASHSTGKIEIVGRLDANLVLRYHEAKFPGDEGRLLAWPFERIIYWFDEVVALSK